MSYPRSDSAFNQHKVVTNDVELADATIIRIKSRFLSVVQNVTAFPS
jgi:hypothetical protein